MPNRKKFMKTAETLVAAVQLDLETAGFTYRKWDAEQTCKKGDWIVNNDGDVYTVDRESFQRTYQAAGPGLYRKTAPVWAEKAERDGSVPTKEGETHYKAGDYVVSNHEDGRDSYAVAAAKFESMYAPVE
jgi:hypothetical protein